MPIPPTDPAKAAEVVALRREGLTVAEISRRAAMPTSTVTKLIWRFAPELARIHKNKQKGKIACPSQA